MRIPYLAPCILLAAAATGCLGDPGDPAEVDDLDEDVVAVDEVDDVVVDELAAPSQAAAIPHETDWMSGRYGVGFHYLQNWMSATKNGGPDEWNAAVRSFDVRRFARDVAATGARWVIFTVGQNSGYYCAPNSVLDHYSGYRPGERNSTRDLPKAMADALAAKGIKLILYLPSNAPKLDERIARGFGLTRKASDGNWFVDRAFVAKWSRVIEEWSRRYGTKVAGWWFDGFYGSRDGFVGGDARTYAEAARAGNPDAVVAFNPGANRLRQVAPVQDYTAGEAGDLRLRCAARLVRSAQCAIFVPVGSWGGGTIRYTGDEIVDYTNRQLGVGGAMTWNLGVSVDGKVNADKRELFEQIRGRVHLHPPAGVTQPPW